MSSCFYTEHTDLFCFRLQMIQNDLKKIKIVVLVGGARVIWGRGQERSLLIGSWIVPLGVSGNTSGRGGGGVVFSEV